MEACVFISFLKEGWYILCFMQNRASSCVGIDENQLMLAIATHQDKAAFVLLFNCYSPRLKSWLLRQGIAAEQAEEIIQETWIAVWQKAPLFMPQRASFSTWLFTIARNKRVDFFRRFSYPEVVFMEATETENIEMHQVPQWQVLENKSVQEALKKLPEAQFEILYDVFFTGQTQQQVSEQRGIPLGTVKSRTRLAFEALRKVLCILILFIP